MRLSIYLIGSLRNPEVPKLAAQLREEGHDVFEDWFAAGPEADDWWQRYEQGRKHSYTEALAGYAAQHVYQYDRFHLDRCNVGVLLLPAGKSGHLELGYMIGQGKPGFILLDKEPERFDVMYNFATVCADSAALCAKLHECSSCWPYSQPLMASSASPCPATNLMDAQRQKLHSLT